VVPIVSSCRENGNACQQTPEHGNKMYERGGGPAHQCSHTVQVLGVGHIQENPRSSTWFQAVPIVSTSMQNGNACQHSLEHGNKIERGGDLHTSAAIRFRY